MTAWQEVQLDWAIKTEQKQVTGVLLWDLSAALDTHFLLSELHANV